MSNKSFNTFLQLSDKERAIIETLQQSGSMRPTDIARNSSVERTTINYNLKKLKERGIVRKVEVEGHHEWQLESDATINEYIGSTYKFFNNVDTYKKAALSDNAGVEILTGDKALKNAYEELLELKKGTRIHTIEGNNLKKQLNAFSHNYILDLQEQYKKSGLIFDGIISKSTLETFKNLDPEILKRHKERLTVLYVVNNRHLDFDMHIVMYQNHIKMINFADKLVFSIKNEFIKQALFSLHQALQSLGKKVSINKIIEGQLQKMNGK